MRGLDAFEKSTLLILTGSMVSRNLRNTGQSTQSVNIETLMQCVWWYCLGHGNDAIFGHHLNIGSLIGLLCEGLEEQIQSRTYFYKNSKLVGDHLHSLIPEAR